MYMWEGFTNFSSVHRWSVIGRSTGEVGCNSSIGYCGRERRWYGWDGVSEEEEEGKERGMGGGGLR